MNEAPNSGLRQLSPTLSPNLPPNFSPTFSPIWRLANFYFWYFAFIGVFGTYFALYLQSLGFSAAEIALLMSLQQVVRIVTPFFWGWLADRLQRRTLIIRATMVLAIFAFALLFLVRGYAATAIVFAIMFSLWSAALPLFEATVLAAVGGDSGRYARIRLWGSVGFIIAVMAAGAALDFLAMDSLLWMVLALLALAAISAWGIADHKPRAADTATVASIWPILQRPPVIALFAACFLMMATQSANFVFYSIYMVDSGHSKSMVGMLWSLGVVAEITVFIFLPKLNARFTSFGMFYFSFLVTALRYLVVGWFPESLALQLIAQTCHAFTYGTWHASAMFMLHRWFPGGMGARGQALYASLAFGVGGALGCIAAGVAWDAIGAAWMFSAMSLLVMIGGVIAFRYVRDPPLNGSIVS